MRFATTLKLAVVGAVALIVALVTVVKSIDVNNYRDALTEAAKSATGRDLVINGKLSLKVSLTPALIAEDVTLSNASWGSRRDMVTLHQIRAEIGLLPLLVREVRISRFVLEDADILLERNAQGQANWDVHPSGKAAFDRSDGPTVDIAGTPTTFKIGQVRIENARIVFRDARLGHDQIFLVDQLTADADSFSSPIGLNAHGNWNNQHFDVSGILGATKGLLVPATPYPAKLKLVLPGLVATISGAMTLDKAAGVLLGLQVTADATDLAEAARLGGYALPPMGAARVALTVSGPIASPSLTNIDMAFGRRDLFALTAKGAIKNPRSLSGVDLLLFIEGENLAGLNRDLDLPIPLGGLKASGHLIDVDGGWRLADVKLVSGHSDLAGDITLRMVGARPAVDAHLASAAIDFDELAGPKVDRGRGRTEAARAFSDDPLPLSILRSFDANVSWTIDRLQKGGLGAQQGAVSLTLKDARLNMTSNLGAVADGKAKASVTLDASGKTANASLGAELDRVILGDVLTALDITRSLHGARTNLRLNLKGSGNSVHAIMAKLNGESFLVVDKGTIDGAYADAVALDVVRQLAPWTQEKNTQMHCLVSRFSVAEGMARSEALLFDTDNMTVSGQGSVNLANEVLDLTIAPKPKDVSLLSLAIPLDVGGTITHPSVTPDRGAIVKGFAGVVGAVALGPIGVLAPLISAGSDETNPCLAALNQSKKAIAPAKKSNGKTPLGELGKTFHKMLGN